MRTPRLLLGTLGLALVLSGLGCGGSSYRAEKPSTPTVTPYASTVATLIQQKTSETTQPEKLETLNLTGFETEDPKAFDAVLGK